MDHINLTGYATFLRVSVLLCICLLSLQLLLHSNCITTSHATLVATLHATSVATLHAILVALLHATLVATLHAT